MSEREKRAERYSRRVARRRQDKFRANIQRMLLGGVVAYLVCIAFTMALIGAR